MRMAGLFGMALLVLCGCPSKGNDAPKDAGAMAVGSGQVALSDASASPSDDIEPVYPIEPNAPAEPLATKLCEGLSTTPEKKRSACCKATPAIVTTSECTRALSAAIRHQAVTIDEKDIDTCLAAYDRTLEGCDWVGPFPPGPPAACEGILKGKLAAGTKCRSSLECAGDLRCAGLGPTSPGTCTASGKDGESCGGTVDPLAGFTRQTDVDKRHPDCKDRCIKHRCAAAVGESGVCLVSADCLDGLQCLPSGGVSPRNNAPLRKCVAGKPPPKEGEACPDGTCAGELQCIRDKCAARKASGESCTDDFECKGGCLRDGGAIGKPGTCGMRCDIR